MLDPKPGLVIRYDFLWKEEERAGRTEGRKDRPCAIVVATRPNPNGSRTVVLCPITHTPPKDEDSAVEIPVKMARYLSLDNDRMWIKTHQVNILEWEKRFPPTGVVPASKGRWAFGQLHAALTKQVIEQVRNKSRSGGLDKVKRESDAFFKEALRKNSKETK